MFETFLPSHGGVERHTVIVEPAWRGVKGVVVAAQEIQLVNNLVATDKPVREKLR